VDILTNFLIGIVSGIVSAVIILALEKGKRSSLEFNVGEIYENSENGFKILRARVKNKPLSRPFSFIYRREPALMCLARIVFFYLDEKPVHPQECLVGRWSTTPLPIRQVSDNEVVDNIFEIRDWVDIPPNGNELLDIVAKAKGETSCCPWNNQIYRKEDWCEKWKLEKDRYYVYVVVKTGGSVFDALYVLINENYPRLEIVNDKDLKNRLRQNSSCP